MTLQETTGSDPLIEDVRRRRAELYKSLGGDLRKLFERIQRVQEEHPEKVVKAQPTTTIPSERS